MYCTQCGKELKEGIKFCTNCGSVIKNRNNDPESVSQMNLSEAGRDSRTDVPDKTPAKKNKKGALIAIIVLLIVLILGVSGTAFWMLGGRDMILDVFGITEYTDIPSDESIEQENFDETSSDKTENSEIEEENFNVDKEEMETSKDDEELLAESSTESPELQEIDDIQDSTDADTEYVLEYSDSEYLSKNDLYGLTAEQCRIARNELYARHGRLFDDEELQKYFDSCSWYIGSISAEEFSESMLNEYEIANRDLIVEYEKEMGYR